MKRTHLSARRAFLALALCLLVSCALIPAAQVRAAAQKLPAPPAVSPAASSVEVPALSESTPALNEPETVSVPILMYHSLTDDLCQVMDLQVCDRMFRTQLRTLHAQGYQSVTYQQLYDFVVNGGSLPDKPVVITFDDGYRNNITLGAPVLEQFGFCAEIAVIGCSVGKDSYKNMGIPIAPHFSLEEARPWVEKGVVHLHSHSYDMHRFRPLDGPECRDGVLPFPGEDEKSYYFVLFSDFLANRMLLSPPPEEALAFTYPYGWYSDVTESALQKLGIDVTVTTRSGVASLTRGDPDSLRLLPRLAVENSTGPLELLAMLSPEE